MGSLVTETVNLKHCNVLRLLFTFIFTGKYIYRLTEEMDNHTRALRQTEEHYRVRMAEMKEEKDLALEEKELHCASLIAREQNNQQKQLVK